MGFLGMCTALDTHVDLQILRNTSEILKAPVDISFPSVSFECIGQPLVVPIGMAASGIRCVKFPPVVSNKCPKDNNGLHGANKDMPGKGCEVSVWSDIDSCLGSAPCSGWLAASSHSSCVHEAVGF